jgi:superfamily II DNA or RNA helicase
MESYDKIITNKGYSIRKSILTEKDIEFILKNCVVTPKIDDRYKTKENLSFNIYKESPARYYLPREWAIQKFGETIDILSDGINLSDEVAKFVGNPYDYQKDIINTYLKSKRNGLICVPCGKGKTFMALNIASQIKKRFLIIVDKEFLANQWKNEIQNVMPNLRIGILQAEKRQTETEKYDVTICMIQTLCIQSFPDSFFNDYGLTIFDECHHLGAQHFCKALFKIQTRKLLGLSATPTRADGLTKVFEMFLGKPLFWEKTREPDPGVIVKGIRITCQDPEYLKVPYDYKKDVIIARLVSYILDCKERNKEIVRWIEKLAKDPNRKILVLSARIAHLEMLDSLLNIDISRSYYIGGMKEEVRESGAKESKVLLASYSMASEAMNIKSLNAVILASPKTSIEQSTGRILRTRVSERIIQPMIIDIIDPHDTFISQYRKRKAYYLKCAYNIEELNQGENEGKEITEVVADENGCLFSDE